MLAMVALMAAYTAVEVIFSGSCAFIPISKSMVMSVLEVGSGDGSGDGGRLGVPVGAGTGTVVGSGEGGEGGKCSRQRGVV